jgi:hypothetical protein
VDEEGTWILEKEEIRFILCLIKLRDIKMYEEVGA